jgi:sec-independent protein translocase protein TatC
MISRIDSLNGFSSLRRKEFYRWVVELRWRLIYVGLGFILGSVVLFIRKEEVFEFFQVFLGEADGELEKSMYFLDITEAFTVSLYLCGSLGLIASLPLLWGQIWVFMSSGLYKREQILIGLLGVFSWGLLLLGVKFTLSTLIPRMWVFFLSLQNGEDNILSYFPSVGPYVRVFLSMVWGMIWCSQLPLFAWLLVYWGWISPNRLGENKIRSWVLFCLLFVAAVVTPPDVGSQLMVFIPLSIGYEVLVGIVLLESNWEEINSVRKIKTAEEVSLLRIKFSILI